MAFGFGFNKQKVLSSAEKFVQQGKLQNAIAEYDKILKNDANDLTVNNTIGDLYARIGDNAKAVECFKKVGDAYAAQGFTVKGIAMYKKITKLLPSLDASLKLAELYTQQGLFNDARAQYLQVAEDFMKNGDLDQAVRLFQKVLEMDPENVPMRVKLAEVYLRINKKKEAWEILSAAAESLRARGQLAAAEDILKKMQTLDPGSSYVLLLRGKAAIEGDDPKSAIGYLEKAADLDSHPEGLRDLLKAYLQIGNVAKAGPIAEKLLTVHNDPEGLFLQAEGCTRLGQYHEALDVYTRHADRLLTTDSAKLLASLHTMIAQVRDDAGALDSLLQLLNKAGESTHVNEVTELLAHASVKNGDLARARDLYQMLSTTEPQNQMHTQNYQQVVARLEESSPSVAITAEEGGVIVEELEATAPVLDQSYPDAVAVAVRAAVTDADLFLSYNLPDKAVVPLLAALPQAPRDARLNQRLAALHTRFHRFTEAAVCCRTLESVYSDAGHPDEAMRYGDLAERYERSAAAAPALVVVPPAKSSPIPSVAAPTSVAPAKASVPTLAPPSASKTGAQPAARAAAAAAPWPAAASPVHQEPAHQEFVVQEAHSPTDAHDASSEPSSDLASEWEDSLSVEEPVAAKIEAASADTAAASDNPEIAETVEEVRFYLEHFMNDQARSGLEKLETLTSDARILDPLRSALANAGKPGAASEPEIAEINADEINADEVTASAEAHEIGAGHTERLDIETHRHEAYNDEVAAAPELMSGFDHGNHTHSPADIAPEPGYTSHMHDEPAEPEPIHAQAETTPVEAATPASSSDDELSSFVADLEASLGDSFPQAPPVEAAPKPSATKSPIKKPAAAVPSLPGWPTAPAAKPTPVAPAPVKKAPEPTPAPPVRTEIPSAPMPAVAATASGAAAAVAPAPVPAMSYSPSPARPLGSAQPAEGVDLSAMFGELKQELEEEGTAGSSDDDPETHYNLGVAFREMGLLDEAIAELQKVCASMERGHAFSQPVQTYTWLAQCFLDKGVPEAAIRWYEKALNIPGLDAEARIAINYELGSACESASDKPAALRHFTSVYGANIDYRDVAERIQALKS